MVALTTDARWQALYPLLLRVARHHADHRHSAEELIAETWLALRRRNPAALLLPAAQLVAYFAVALPHMAVDLARRDWHTRDTAQLTARQTCSLDAPFSDRSPTTLGECLPAPHDTAQAAVTRLALADLLAGVDHDRGLAFQFAHAAGWTHQEIAAATGLSRQAVNVAAMRARGRLVA